MIDQNQQEVKNLWDEYRLGKCFVCQSDVLQHAIYRVVKNKLTKQYDLGPQGIERIPRPGSIFYVTEIDPPPWFESELSHDNMILALQADKPIEKPKKIKRGKRRKK